jgi:hypothetical protein
MSDAGATLSASHCRSRLRKMLLFQALYSPKTHSMFGGLLASDSIQEPDLVHLASGFRRHGTDSARYPT